MIPDNREDFARAEDREYQDHKDNTAAQPTLSEPRCECGHPDSQHADYSASVVDGAWHNDPRSCCICDDCDNFFDADE